LKISIKTIFAILLWVPLIVGVVWFMLPILATLWETPAAKAEREAERLYAYADKVKCARVVGIIKRHEDLQEVMMNLTRITGVKRVSDFQTSSPSIGMVVGDERVCSGEFHFRDGTILTRHFKIRVASETLRFAVKGGSSRPGIRVMSGDMSGYGTTILYNNTYDTATSLPRDDSEAGEGRTFWWAADIADATGSTWDASYGWLDPSQASR
jgi:hypothetical protein